MFGLEYFTYTSKICWFLRPSFSCSRPFILCYFIRLTHILYTPTYAVNKVPGLGLQNQVHQKEEENSFNFPWTRNLTNHLLSTCS
jgi:hypothetical protein